MKKLFDNNNPNKRFNKTHNRFRASIFDETSDMIKAKKVKLKDSRTEDAYRPIHVFDPRPAPCEAREVPAVRPIAASNEPKTSEFACFKKLKKGAGCASGLKRVDKENMRDTGPSNDFRDFGNSKHKDFKSSLYVQKSSTADVGPSLSRQDAALESSGMPSKEHDGNERIQSSSLIRTPDTVDFNSFLAKTATASLNRDMHPESQLKDGDIFFTKRLKLQKQIAKTLFPEADKLPEECDIVSLLLSRLLPESSLTHQSESRTLRQQETKDQKCRLHLHEEENWGASGSVSSSWSHRFEEILPSSQKPEGINISAIGCANRMLTGHNEGNEQGSFVNEMDTVYWSEKCGEQNLLTWRNKDYDHSTACNNATSIFMNELPEQFAYNVFGRDQAFRYSDQAHSYELIGGICSSFADSDSKRSDRNNKDEKYNFDLDRKIPSSPGSWYNSSVGVASERFGSSALSNLSNYYEPRHLIDYESRVHRPLLLRWGDGEPDARDITQTSDMEIELYTPSSRSEDDQHCRVNSNTSLEVYASSFPPSSLLHLPPCTYQDNYVQRHHPKLQRYPIERPSCTYASFYDPETLRSDIPDLFKNIYRESHFFIMPENHCSIMQNIVSERTCPAFEAFVVSEELDSDLGLNCKSVSVSSEALYDVSTDVLQHLRQETPSSHHLAMPHLEDWSLRSVDFPAHQDVSSPVLLHDIRWTDAERRSYYDDSRTTTCDNLL